MEREREREREREGSKPIRDPVETLRYPLMQSQLVGLSAVHMQYSIAFL
jgi:hypothetical protein